MADRDDHRHPSRDMRKAEPGQRFAFFIRDQELFGEIGEDADPVDTLIDHAVEHPGHAGQIEASVRVKRGRRNRPDSGIFGGHHVFLRQGSGSWPGG